MRIPALSLRECAWPITTKLLGSFPSSATSLHGQPPQDMTATGTSRRFPAEGSGALVSGKPPPKAGRDKAAPWVPSVDAWHARIASGEIGLNSRGIHHSRLSSNRQDRALPMPRRGLSSRQPLQYGEVSRMVLHPPGKRAHRMSSGVLVQVQPSPPFQ